jgi:hypothetical protein
MDRKSYQNPEILRIVERSAAARDVLRMEIVKLKHQLDVPGRVRDSLQQKPNSWLLGSAAAGLAAGFLFPRFRRTPRPTPAKSTSSRLLGLAWSATLPFAKVWLTNQLRSWLAQRAETFTSPSPSRNPLR